MELHKDKGAFQYILNYALSKCSSNCYIKQKNEYSFPYSFLISDDIRVVSLSS